MYPIKYYLNTDYQEMELLGVTGLFTNMRIERESLPEGFFKYSLREGDEEFFSTDESAVLVNHAGDFICKEQIDFGGADYKDLGENYTFTDNPVKLDEFFGVDILDKVAEELDAFMRDIAPYEYADSLTSGQTNMVEDIRAMLNDREQTEGIFKELSEICDEVSFADKKAESLAQSLRNKVREIFQSFPEKRLDLSQTIAAAEKQREECTL